MASTVLSTLYGTVAGGLIFGTRLFTGSVASENNNDPKKKSNKGNPLAIERKLNNHIEDAFQYIQDWKTKYDISCEIYLSYGDGENQTVKLSHSTIVGGEDKVIFLKALGGDRLSKFEKLASDLRQENIPVTDESGERLNYKYFEKIKDSCKGKSITLTFQELTWRVNGNREEKHSFWLPKEESGQSNRTLVFNYLDRDITKPLEVIREWQKQNNNCEIVLVVNERESITVSKLESNPKSYIGSPLFLKNYYSGSNLKISKFQKLANDLEKKKIRLTNEYGEILDYNYSQKLKDSCKSNSITLDFQTLSWNSGSKQQHSFWLPKEDNDNNRSLVFNYQERDYLQISLDQIKKWKRDNGIENCEIILVVDSNESITLSRIEFNPYKFLGSKLFVQDFIQNNKKISKFQKLVQDLTQGEIEVVAEDGERIDYNYSQKLIESCKSGSIKLSLKKVSWTPIGHGTQSHTFWLPEGETDNKILVFNYLKRDYETSLAKIKNWKTQNGNCEITLFMDDSESITLSQIENNPNSHLGSKLFTRDLEDKSTGRRLSRFEKLANDLENKTRVTNEYGETLYYNYSQKLRDSCKSNSIILSLKEVYWTEKENTSRKHSHFFWLPRFETDNKTLVFNYLERDYQTNLEKIKNWQVENGNCEIVLRLENSKETIKINDFSLNPYSFLGSELFVQNFITKDGSKISRFEKLAQDLDNKEIRLTNGFGEELVYNYTQKLKDSCGSENQLTLTLQTLTWKAKKVDYSYTFWLPESERDLGNRSLVFNYQNRDYQTPLQKIKKWKKENQVENCEITLHFRNESIKVSEISSNPHRFLGSPMFVQDLSSPTNQNDPKISRFEKFANDLEKAKIEVIDEYGEELYYEYSEQIKDLCRTQKNSVAFKFLPVGWWDNVNNQIQKYLFWLWEGVDINKKSKAVLSYLDRDYKTSTEIIKQWQDENGNCEIQLILYASRGLYATADEVMKDPRKYISEGLFTRELDTLDGKKQSRMERLAQELYKKDIKVIDRYGFEFSYNYSESLKRACRRSSNRIQLSFHFQPRYDEVKKTNISYRTWTIKELSDKEMIYDYLERDFQTPLQKIKRWEEENACELEIQIPNGEVTTISKIMNNPFDYSPYEIFDKKVFIGDYDEAQLQFSEGLTKYSQIEKLAKDLNEGKIKVLSDYEGKLSYFHYSEKVKESCSNGKAYLYWKVLNWRKNYDNKNIDHLYYYWTWDKKQLPGYGDWLIKNIHNISDKPGTNTYTQEN